MEEKKLSEQESLALITKMIHTAKNSFVDTGIGPILWGLVISVCAIIQAAQIHFDFRLPIDIWWLALGAILPQIYISIQENRERKVRSWTDQIISYVWMTFGFGIFIINFITSTYAQKIGPVLQEYIQLTGKDPDLFFWSYGSSFLMFLYGVPTIITAAAHKFRLMLAGGILCWVCSIIGVYTPVKIDFLMMSLCAICAWLIPGIIIRRKYLSQRTSTNV